MTRHVYGPMGTYPLVAAPSIGATAAAFLARTSGLDTTHINAYTALLNGLDTDGLTVKFDMLHIYATQDSTTALLNLVSTNYNGITHGSPVFTADRGFQGIDGSSTVYIDTGFNPTTAVSPNYIPLSGSGHVSTWSVTNAAATTNYAIGHSDGVTWSSGVVLRHSINVSQFNVNCTASNFSNINAQGHFIANRTGTFTFQQGYINGVQVLSNSISVGTAINCNMYTIGLNSNGSPIGGNIQAAMASIGSQMSSTDATNFYNRLRTYMTAVGVP